MAKRALIPCFSARRCSSAVSAMITLLGLSSRASPGLRIRKCGRRAMSMIPQIQTMILRFCGCLRGRHETNQGPPLDKKPCAWRAAINPNDATIQIFHHNETNHSRSFPECKLQSHARSPQGFVLGKHESKIGGAAIKQHSISGPSAAFGIMYASLQ